MKRLQDKIWAKIVAFVLCLAGVYGLIVNGILFFLVNEEPKEEQALKNCYEQIISHYSYEIFEEMMYNPEGVDKLLEKYQEKNWTFGIVKTEKAEGTYSENPVDFSYISEGNTLSGFDFYVEGSNYSYYRYQTDSLWAMITYPIRNDDLWNYSYTEPFSYVEMNKDTGIMYAHISSGYMALHRLAVQKTEESDWDYLSLVHSGNGESYYVSQSTGEPVTASQLQQYPIIHIISDAGEDMAFEWGETDVRLQNKIYLISSDEMIKPIFDSPDNYIENSGLKYYANYINMPSDYVHYGLYADIKDDFIYHDELSQVTMTVKSVYSMKGAYAYLLLGNVFMVVAGISFLLYAAGHKKGQEGIALNYFDKIPLEILAVANIVIYPFLWMVILESLYSWLKNGEALISLVAVFLFIAVGVTALTLMSIAARKKAGRLLKNTIIYWIGEKIAKLVGFIWGNISLFLKCVLAIGLITMVQVLVVGYFSWDAGFPIMVIIMGAMLELALVFFAFYQMKILKKGMEKVAEGNLSEKVDTSRLFWEFKKHGEQINKAGEGISAAVEKQMKSERFRTELITNVSHDIKTPLTSIINYVDLIKKEEPQNENIKEYIEVLNRQSNRLKKLIEDLMEASKASTGNLPVQMEDCDVSVLLTQLVGEYEEKLESRNLELVVSSPSEPVMIKADGRYLWRVFDNMMNNIFKYALPGTRVYVNMEKDTLVRITFRNISSRQLNNTSEELMERFVRGDSSRNTEGSGLGLSIAQSLTILMNGKMKLDVDGDLFKVTLTFPILLNEN